MSNSLCVPRSCHCTWLRARAQKILEEFNWMTFHFPKSKFQCLLPNNRNRRQVLVSTFGALHLWTPPDISSPNYMQLVLRAYVTLPCSLYPLELSYLQAIVHAIPSICNALASPLCASWNVTGYFKYRFLLEVSLFFPLYEICCFLLWYP